MYLQEKSFSLVFNNSASRKNVMPFSAIFYQCGICYIFPQFFFGDLTAISHLDYIYGIPIKKILVRFLSRPYLAQCCKQLLAIIVSLLRSDLLHTC